MQIVSIRLRKVGEHDQRIRHRVPGIAPLVPQTRGMVVSFGLPVHYGGGLFNMAALAVDGNLLGLVGKKNLAGDGVHYEPRWFKPWPAGAQAALEIGGRAVPIGDRPAPFPARRPQALPK